MRAYGSSAVLCRGTGQSRVRGALLVLALVPMFCAIACEQPSRGWLGINMQLGHVDYGGRWPSAKPTAADREIHYDLARELGVHHVRDVFMSWYRAESRQGQPYDFTVSDDLAARAGASDIEILSLCWVIPSWAAADPGTAAWSFGVPKREASEAFVRFVSTFVERYDGDGARDVPGLKRPVHVYEFMTQMEDVPPDEYAHWLKVFHDAVKSADANATVIVGGLTSPGVRMVNRPEGHYHTYFERMMASKELTGPQFPYFDAVGFCNYPVGYPGRPPFVDATAYLRDVLDRVGLRRPLWLVEFGVSSGGNSAAEQAFQAREIPKLVLAARVAGVERAYLHTLWDYELPGHPGVVDSFGLILAAPSGRLGVRKASFGSFTMVTGLLEDGERLSFVRPGLYAIRGAREAIYVAWREDTYSASARNDDLASQWWQVTSLNGRREVRHGSAVHLTSEPVVLRATQSPFIAP